MGYLLIFFAVVIGFALVGYLQGVKVKKEEALIQEHTSEIFSGLKSKYLNSTGELKSKYHKSSSDSHISLDIDMPKNILKVGFDLNDTKNGFYDEGITTYYNGKPFSGIGYETFENKKIKGYTNFKKGLKEGIGKRFDNSGKLSQWALYKNDQPECAILFKNGKRAQEMLFLDSGNKKIIRVFFKDYFVEEKKGFENDDIGARFNYQDFDDIESGKYGDNLFTAVRNLSFAFMNRGLINFYKKKSSKLWIGDNLVWHNKKDGKYYTFSESQIKKSKKANPKKLVNGIVYDLQIDGSIKSTTELINGEIVNEPFFYKVNSVNINNSKPIQQIFKMKI